MEFSNATLELSLPPLVPKVDEEEVLRHRSLGQHSEGQVGTGEPRGPPAKRFKLVFKRDQVLPNGLPPRRTGRAVRQPAVFVPTPVAPSAANKRARGSRKKANIVCAKCQRGHSPSTNMIVFCDGCNETWHQKCHDPPIDDEVVQVEEAEWLCHQCKPEPAPAAVTSRPAPASKTGRTIHPRLQQAPRLDVGGNKFSSDETRAYLSSLSHAALVELVVNVSSQNPTVPMFPANMRDLPATAFPVPPARPDATITNSKKRTRAASTANDDQSGIASARTRERTRTTSAPAMAENITRSGKRTRAASTAIEQPFESGPVTTSKKRTRSTSVAAGEPVTNLRKRTRTTSASTKPPAVKALPKRPESVKGSKEAKARSRTNSTSTRRQASARPSIPTSSTTRSRDRSTTPLPSRPTRDTSPDESEPDTHESSDDDEFFETQDHRTYPPAGQGLFSFPSNPAVLSFLQEPSDSPSISHALHGPAKTDRPIPTWGPAMSG